MNATELNAKWDELSSTLNTYPDLDKNTTAQLNKAISDWQDWYYSETNFDNWGDVNKWIDAYNIANELLAKSVKKKKLKVKAPVVTTPKKATTVLPPLTVFGRVPKNIWLYVTLTVGALGVLWYMDEKDRKKPR